MVNFSPNLQTEVDEELLQLLEQTARPKYTLHTNRASNANGAGLVFIIKSPQGDIITQAIYCEFKATNNETEYEALIVALNAATNFKFISIEGS